MSRSLEKLREVGFVRVGRWFLNREELQLELDFYRHETQLLYAFVSGDDVLFVGTTMVTLGQRLGQHRNPGRTQSTHLKTNRKLREALTAGMAVEIWARRDEDPQRYGAFELNLAAGLKGSIIEVLAPEWNGVDRTAR